MRVRIGLALLVTLVFATADPAFAQPAGDEVPRRERRKSAIASKIFRGDWWDYYNRAITKFDAGDLQGAEADLREAIKFRPDESARARTYGVRFQEYFPKAELGAVLYEMGRYWEAAPVLQESLASAAFDQTKFYLHEARRQVALRSPIDKALPSIRIADPAPGLVTNRTSITIRGQATDDLFVDRILVGERPILIDRAKSSLDFQVEVPLPNENNSIPITVYDLLGQHQTQVVSVETDRLGPVFSLERMERLGQDRVKIRGMAYDRHGLAAVEVAGTRLPLAGGNSTRVDVEAPLQGEDEIVHLQLADGFQNETLLQLSPKIKVGKAPSVETRVRVAASSPLNSWLVAASVTGPRIDLLGLQPGQVVYQEEVYIDGRVRDASGVRDIRVNGLPVDIPEPGPVYDLSFGHAAGPLSPGTNVIEIQARNLGQVESLRPLQIHCELPETELENRLAVTVPPVEVAGVSQDPGLGRSLQRRLITELDNLKRFSIKASDELNEVMLERRIAESPAADTRYRVSDKTLTAADLVLDGFVDVRNTTIHLSVNVVSVQSGDLDASVPPVSAQKSDPDAVDRLAHDMALKIVQRYPLATGNVVAVKPPTTDLAKPHGVRIGMQAIA
ncbi:MAG: tetratricopeptide repeat protein, partial [Candidatus Omnitrophica bacterium]|nr:tetratricopeptide repeat protein [Candidatus Omnitrophota bacterium]